MIVAIVDCGSGNLRSVTRALEHAAAEGGIRAEVIVTHVPEQVRAANRIVLPGQGAFASCLAGLNRVDGLRPALEEAVRGQGKPFFGICVGMQLMADVGEEHGRYPGFGWIPGHVVPLRPSDPTLKIPHMGWNALEIRAPVHPVLANLPADPHVYFVHSYQLSPSNPDDCLAVAEYGGPVTAAVGRDNLIGTQFHPEKSQAVGLTMLRQFLTWEP
ncbi:MAG: imidazole glycerol phosphate synthase subunit HisH [Alphaproteobacteria bacterium]|nr:imidazole glycerol phosphate synthase subunit HisH [Alphaproteobacteria bacterium]